MNASDYHALTQALLEALRARSDVLGLVAVGSMAAQDIRPDAWSDHDFFVVTQPGAQEGYRTQLTWLPHHEAIAWHFRETQHGVKVVYRDGHLLEFAVFDTTELPLAQVNRYRVLLDKGDISAQLAAVQRQTSAGTDAAPDVLHAGQFLTNLLVGIGRYQRGEMLSAHQFIKCNALHHLLTLLHRQRPSAQAALADNLAPTRRFEWVHPGLGAELRALLLEASPQAAAGLLALFEREVAGQITAVSHEFIQIVAQKIDAAR